MENINISQLSVQDMLLVLAIDELKSVSLAAVSINITQPTASYRLNKLRDIFNDPIFTNVNRAMRPTLMGQRIIETFRKQVDDISDLTAPAEFNPAESTRKFTLNSPGFFLPHVYNTVPAIFFNEAPNAELFFDYIPELDSIHQQLHERLDVYSWVFDREGAAGIRRLVFPEVKMLVYYDPEFRDPPTTIEEFAQCGFARLTSPFKHDLFDHILENAGYPPQEKLLSRANR